MTSPSNQTNPDATSPPPRLRVGVLASGSGRSLENLIELSRSGDLPIDVVCVIVSRADAFAIERARGHQIPSFVLSPRDFVDADAFATRLFDTLDEHRVDLALLAGYLVRLPMLPAWHGRVMNIHPALLPAFGGKGFYGHHVHDAVRKQGVKVTGCTVHFVDDEYDHGPIIVQRTVAVEFDDSAETIANRVFEAELVAYPEAIRLYAEGRLSIEDGRVRIESRA